MTNESTLYFEIRDTENFIRIYVNGLNYPNAELDWDRNWVNTLVLVKAGAFNGEFKADSMTTDFEIFKKELKALYQNLDREATFKGIESQVTIRVQGDGIGHLKTECSLLDYAGTGNELKCELEFDQTQLPELIDQLEQITIAFPTTGELKIKN